MGDYQPLIFFLLRQKVLTHEFSPKPSFDSLLPLGFQCFRYVIIRGPFLHVDLFLDWCRARSGSKGQLVVATLSFNFRTVD